MKEKIKLIKQYLFVVKQITYKDNKRKTSEMNLGFLWNVLNPFIYMVILSTYYQNVIKHDNIINFPIFVFVGITIYNFYLISTRDGMVSLIGEQNLIINSSIPVDIFILQKIFIALKEMLFSIIALVPILYFFRIHIHCRALLIIPIILITFFTAMGIATILAVAAVFFDDIIYLYSVFMTLMMFVSGTFIPIESLPIKFQKILTYNPIFLSIYLCRNCVIYNRDSHWTAWAKLIVWMVGSLLFGHWLLYKLRPYIVNKL